MPTEETVNNDITTNEQSDLELRARIAEAEAQTATEARRAEEARQQAVKTESEIATHKLNNLLTAALAQSDVKFHPGLSELRIIADHACKITFSLDGNGNLQAARGGQPMPVQKALDTLALEAPYTAQIDCTGVQRLRMTPGEGVKARSDLGTAQERSEFITRNGLAAFEALPTHRLNLADVASMTGAEYKRLSVAQKTEIVHQYGSDAVARIVARKG